MKCTLAGMFGCMELQPNGEWDGALKCYRGNFFYIRDNTGMLQEVECRLVEFG